VDLRICPVPIIVRLDVVLAMRKMQLTIVAEKVGMTPQNLSIIKTGKARGIRFRTLEKLCEVLDCQPGDLLVYEKDS
jgi:putative transcriptional regulator